MNKTSNAYDTYSSVTKTVYKDEAADKCLRFKPSILSRGYISYTVSLSHPPSPFLPSPDVLSHYPDNIIVLSSHRLKKILVKMKWFS